MPEVIAVLDPEVGSREFTTIRIGESANGIHIFGPYRVGDIPFSQPPAGQHRLTVDQRPIALDEVPSDLGSTFEDRMRNVRLINSIRLDGKYGTTIGNSEYRNRSHRREDVLIRPEIRTAIEEDRLVVPPSSHA